MAYFLGIDGGGTKTTCLLGDESHVLTSETVGGSNIVRLGEEHVRNTLRQGMHQACAALGIQPGEISVVCAGLSGAARADVQQLATQILMELTSARISVVGDMVVAHEAALHGLPGIVVIAGTGSIAYGRDKAGRTARAGGWGYMISDEGSGHWIGVEAVKDIMRTEDRGRPTSLTERIFEHWNLGSLDELVRRANASPPPDFASLFPAVLALEAHDAVAGAILQRAGRALADLAAVVHRTLWSSDSVVPIAMSGGVFHHSATVCQQFEGQLQSLNLPARVYLNHTNPAEGALSLARKMVAVSG